MSGRRPGAAPTPGWDNGDVPEYRDVRREADGTAGRPYETRRPRGRHLKNRLHSAHGQRRRRRARRAALHQLPGVRRDRQRQPTTSSKIAPDVDVPRASLTKRARSPWKRLGSTAGTSRPPSVVFSSGGVRQKSGDAAIFAPGRSARARGGRLPPHEEGVPTGGAGFTERGEARGSVGSRADAARRAHELSQQVGQPRLQPLETQAKLTQCGSPRRRRTRASTQRPLGTP